MHKFSAIIMFIISAVFPCKAVDVAAADSLKILYDDIYAVDWMVNIYTVADVFTFPQDSIDIVCEALNSPQKEILADGNWILCYYPNTSFQEARNIKRDIEKVDLPHGYKWGFGMIEDETERLTLIVALCESKSPFSNTISQAALLENTFGKPALWFNFQQGESEEPLEKWRKYKAQHNNLNLVFEINGRLFSYTQIKDNDGSITIDYVPRCILEELYKSPRFDVPEVIVE